MTHVRPAYHTQHLDDVRGSAPHRPRLGVCMRSFGVRDPQAILAHLAQSGVGGVQVALDLLQADRVESAALLAGLSHLPIRLISGTMMVATESDTDPLATGVLVPDTQWLDTLRAVERSAGCAADLGLPLVTIHLGFRWDTPAPEQRPVYLQRLRRLTAPFTGRGIVVALPAGRQDVDTTLGLLMELDDANVGVSFDPAEMVRRGTGDPTEALDLLCAHVRQLRVRDAEPLQPSGSPGAEVALGDGAVDWDALFGIVRSREIAAPLVIVRESGHDRLRDIRAAAALVRAHGMDTLRR